MWFYKYLAGIQINEGAESVTINPCFVQSIDWVRASHRGVSVFWNKTEIKIKTDIPATVILNGKRREVPCGEYTFDLSVS